MVPHRFFPKTGTPFSPMKLCTARRPLERNATMKQMETAQITKAAAG
jgi:hypothetical protein